MKDKYEKNFEVRRYEINLDDKPYDTRGHDTNFEDEYEKSRNKVTVKYSILNEEPS